MVEFDVRELAGHMPKFYMKKLHRRSLIANCLITVALLNTCERLAIIYLI